MRPPRMISVGAAIVFYGTRRSALERAHLTLVLPCLGGDAKTHRLPPLPSWKVPAGYHPRELLRDRDGYIRRHLWPEYISMR